MGSVPKDTAMEITAQKRKKLGKKAKKLKKERKIPAVVFGKGFESVPITVDLIQFRNVYREAGETTLVDLKFNGSSEKVLIKDIQLHPITLDPIHIDFYKVDLKEKIRANVPIEISGEEKSPIIESGEGLLLTLLQEIEVEALPEDLPSAFRIDVSRLSEIDQGITAGELNYNKEKVEIIDVAQEELIVKIDYAEMEEEEEEEELSEEELVEGVKATEEKDEIEEEEEGEKETEETEEEN
jgi:large subunit ribosomal protein L25